MIPENQLLDRAGPVHPPSLPLPALSERRHRSLARQLVSMRSSTYVATPGADAAQISCIILSSSAPSCTLFQSRSLAGQSIPAGPEPETEPDMPIYPLELCKRLEEKWKRRAGETGSTSQTPQTGKNRSVVGSAPQEEGDAILSRWPWLLAIGQGLQSEYAALKQPVEKRLVTLLKKLRRSRAR
jgi:hypothetical protein